MFLFGCFSSPSPHALSLIPSHPPPFLPPSSPLIAASWEEGDAIAPPPVTERRRGPEGRSLGPGHTRGWWLAPGGRTRSRIPFLRAWQDMQADSGLNPSQQRPKGHPQSCPQLPFPMPRQCVGAFSPPAPQAAFWEPLSYLSSQS